MHLSSIWGSRPEREKKEGKRERRVIEIEERKGIKRGMKEWWGGGMKEKIRRKWRG